MNILSEEKADQNRTQILAVCLGAKEASWVLLLLFLISHLYKKLQLEL